MNAIIVRPYEAGDRAALRHGLLLRPGTGGFLWRGLWDSIALGGAPSGQLEDARWPSHLHINLLAKARGRGAGARLMRAWFERLRDVPAPGMRTPAGGRHHLQHMVRSTSSA